MRHPDSLLRSPVWFLFAAIVSLLSISCRSERSQALDAGNPTAAETATWLLALFGQGRGPTEAEVSARFSEAALRELPNSTLRATLSQLAQTLPPIRVVEQREESAQQFVALLETSQGRLELQIGMTVTEPRRIAVLLFAPPALALGSYEEGAALLHNVGAHSQLAAYELIGGRCQVLFAHNPERLLAIGSTHKLWVLLALTEKLKSEAALSWNSPLAIRDELKSLPSGVLQDSPAGTRLSLLEVATKMISISDNTATDHLLDFLGRQAVERAQTTSGHSAPERNIPWLSTRELFVLKLVASESERQVYRSAGVAEKRSQLSELRARSLASTEAVAWTKPRALDLEWFASAPDLCGVLAALVRSAEHDAAAPSLQVLAQNPGLPLEPGAFRYAGFKGGSEPGVINLSWLLQRADGRWFSLVLTVNDADKPLDEATVLATAGGVLRLLQAAP